VCAIADFATGRASASTIPAELTRSIFRAERGAPAALSACAAQVLRCSLGAAHFAFDRRISCAIVRACQMGIRW